MHVSNIPIDELKPFVKNPKKHPEKQIKFLQKSFKEFGWTNPILVAQDNMIVAGHGRWEAAKQAGFSEVPVIKLDMPYEKAVAYVVADNHLAELAETDTEQLAELLQEISQIEDFDIEATGFEMDDIDDMINELHPREIIEDEVPDVPEEAVTQRGDVWELGRHRLMCGDSTCVEDVARMMSGEKADMVFTDPPYGMFLDADFSSMKSKFKGSNGGNKYIDVIGDHADFDPLLIETVFNNFGYCKDVFLWGADYYSELLPDKNTGSWVVWDKRLDESADKMFGSTFEMCWSKTRHRRMIARVKWAGIFGMEKEDTKHRQHPTQKPVTLINWFFENVVLDDMVKVVDLFGGSGSTLIACEQTNRINYSMEIDPHYCDVIIQRYVNLTGNTELKRNGEPYTWQVKEK